mmetsp:Transcript_8669/g.15209  ORF Transcript_8669/g.15209 Transcript_8669/m.15209 type:complete len:115 (-) Transcript_8669:93-437(-)
MLGVDSEFEIVSLNIALPCFAYSSRCLSEKLDAEFFLTSVDVSTFIVAALNTLLDGVVRENISDDAAERLVERLGTPGTPVVLIGRELASGPRLSELDCPEPSRKLPEAATELF